MFTLYNVCSVNWGIISTSGDVQYIRGYHYECGGIPCVHRGCSVHRRNTISTLEGRDIMSTLGGRDIMSTLGGRDIMSTLGGYPPMYLTPPIYS